VVLVPDVARNPDARDRMLAEIDDALGDRRPTADDLVRLPWTTACVQESQRYFSAVWIIARAAVKDAGGPTPRPSTRRVFWAMQLRTGHGRHIGRSVAADASASGRAPR
jgi:cytochrome P450